MVPLDFNELTRSRADPDRDDCWHIYRGDVHAGTIAKANGMPNAKNEWRWSAGFYPGSGPGEIKGCTASTFDEARAAFKIACLKFAHSRKPEDFVAWRDHRTRPRGNIECMITACRCRRNRTPAAPAASAERRSRHQP
jgi:hypothetical protein